MRAEYKNDVTMDPSGFVVLAEYIPHIIQEIRYYSTYNFIGDRIDGYEEPVALLTKEAARALKGVSNEMFVQGYRLKVFDAYRPACAVKHFVLWGIEDQDVRMKPYFYPDLEKGALFVEGYIAKKSGHSRGSTIDLTLLDMKTGKEVDMGGPFDYFSELSHPTTAASRRSSMITACFCEAPCSATALHPSTVSGGTSPCGTSRTRTAISASRYPGIP